MTPEQGRLLDLAAGRVAARNGGRLALTDAQAVELLRGLAHYVRDSRGEGVDATQLRVCEVAGDLLDSLPGSLSREPTVRLDAETCRADTLGL